MKTLLELSGVTVSFDGFRAINNLSFQIGKAEMRAIIGPNGAGKSSMLNVISGFYHPQEGEVWFRGERRPAMKPYEVARQGVARTFQNIALFDGMSVLDNIMTGRLTHMKAPMWRQALWWGKAEREESENREQVEKIIDFLEIQNIRKTPVGRLPYGLKKRVELARALAAEPKLLLLDEPTASIDTKGQGEFYALLKELNKTISIIIVSHDLMVISGYVKSVACVNRVLHYHNQAEITGEMLETMYPCAADDTCPVELLAHGLPHRVLKDH